MGLARFDAGDGPRVGLVDSFARTIRDLTALDPSLGDDPLRLDVGDLAFAAAAPVRSLDEVRLLCPLARAGAIYGVGLNYRDHARELGKTLPETPPVFLKPPNALAGPDAEIAVVRGDPSLDYEGELGVVIGRRLHGADRAAAAAAILGYVVANDITLRSLARPETLALAKGLAGAAPVGPWITLARDVPDPQVLGVRTTVNGALRQNGTTADMATGCVDLVALIARTATLERGDLILTGSPSGSGAGFSPPRWLAPGDRVVVEIDGLGAIATGVRESA